MSELEQAQDSRLVVGGDTVWFEGEPVRVTATNTTSMTWTLVPHPRWKRWALRAWHLGRPGCDVYWGSHGCHKRRCHLGACRCDCGSGPPYYGARTVFYGDDAKRRGLNTDFEVTEPCGHCGGLRQNDKPDPCLGMLPGVWGACCGHGDTESAYVAVEGGKALYGVEATDYFARSVRPEDASTASNSSSPGGH